ncbi:hypothetical protein OUZ56_002105 [Daphnia magna]|uniref:Integrase core domain-containing protein n=1 Tax=Daphnia magna TaxID=35525 RepID=A0ABR0A542_9CRUS|nr:hypothetical protein OUZ56_002105 [Daphnia magna]
MWHMDGFHKFDGWGFVHGIVDGHSKAIVGMQVSDNTRLTVVKLLHSSCIIWGTTACLRTDRGGENVLATDYMLNVRGVNRFSFFAGSSMRNQRIERQWRDTNQRGVRPLLNTFN